MSNYAIILNTIENEFINKVIDDINKALNTKSILPPHCTILLFEGDNQSVKKFKAIEVKSLTLNCLGLATFEGDNNTIYIQLEKNKELIDVYNYYLESFKEYEISDFSKFDNYIPHITLATHLSDDEFKIAKEIAEKAMLPKVIKIQSVSIVNSDYIVKYNSNTK